MRRKLTTIGRLLGGAVLFYTWGAGGLLSQAAESFKDAHFIHDGGQRREFLVAVDEFHVLAPTSRLMKFAPLRSAEQVRQQAEAFQQTSREIVGLVLYERGVPHHEFTRRVLTHRVTVRLAPGVDAPKMAQRAGAVSVQPVAGLRGWFQFEANSSAGALELAESLRNQPDVLYAEAQLAGRKQLKLLPNDTYFSQQWHLRNTGQNGGTAGIDINVTSVWDRWRGAGIVIGIVDDGLQTSHADLSPNVDSALGWDFNLNDPNPYPDYSGDTHGTRVAGVTGARGNNGQGVVGVAYEASLAGLRLISGAPAAVETDTQDAAAMLHSNAVIHIKNNSWGAYDGDGRLEGPGPLMQTALAEGTAHGRGGKGTVYVFAGGNGLPYGEDINYDGFANSIHVIAVGAISDRGAQASYSEPGACLVIAAPSGSGGRLCYGGRQGITTTDLMGSSGENYTGASCEVANSDYTQTFDGTSASTPVVSGVVALLLQANPALSHRDVKEILMRSATKVSATDPDWATNSAGVAHNHKFGAGLVNAGAAVALATNWVGLEPQTNFLLLLTNLNLPVPDNNAAGVTNMFVVTNRGFRVENVTLRVTLPHASHGDLAVTLTSPHSLQSRMATVHSSSGSGYNGWTFNSVRHWGEAAEGVWTVKIADLRAGNTGTLQTLELTLYGSVPAASLSIGTTNQHPVLSLRVLAPGWNYVLEESSNLTNWTQIATLPIGPTGGATYLDANVVPTGTFYRARWLP